MPRKWTLLLLLTSLRKPVNKGACYVNKKRWCYNPYSSTMSVLGSFTRTTNPSTRDLQLNVPSAIMVKYLAQGHKSPDRGHEPTLLIRNTRA